MVPERPVLGSPEDWLRHAKADMALARVPLPEGAMLEQLCFHLQQAVEKSIKAVLLQQKVLFPYTHDIARLVTVVKEAAILWPPELDSSAELTRFAVEARYPGITEPIEEEEYRQAVDSAQRVIVWAEGLVNLQPAAS